MDVKQLRTRIGWSQARMAAELGVSRTTVTQWESGTSRPEVDTAWALVDLAAEHHIRMRLQDALPRSRANGAG